MRGKPQSTSGLGRPALWISVQSRRPRGASPAQDVRENRRAHFEGAAVDCLFGGGDADRPERRQLDDGN